MQPRYSNADGHYGNQYSSSWASYKQDTQRLVAADFRAESYLDSAWREEILGPSTKVPGQLVLTVGSRDIRCSLVP